MAEENNQTRSVGYSYSQYPPRFRRKVRTPPVEMDFKGIAGVIIFVALTVFLWALIFYLLFMLG